MKELSLHETLAVSGADLSESGLQYGALLGSIGAAAVFVLMGYLPPVSLTLRAELAGAIGLFLGVFVATD